MSKKPDLTILLISSTRIVRGDIRIGSPAEVELWQQPRPAVSELEILVDAAMRLGPKPGRVTWILSSDIWTHIMNLPVASSSGANRDQLQKALSFEAETLSGINAFDSIVGLNPLGAKGVENQFWVIQVLASQRNALEKVVKSFGSRFGGICHPGGLPRVLAEVNRVPKSWQRIEVWAGGIFCIHNDIEKGITVMDVMNVDLRDNRWQSYIGE